MYLETRIQLFIQADFLFRFDAFRLLIKFINLFKLLSYQLQFYLFLFLTLSLKPYKCSTEKHLLILFIKIMSGTLVINVISFNNHAQVSVLCCVVLCCAVLCCDVLCCVVVGCVLLDMLYFAVL